MRPLVLLGLATSLLACSSTGGGGLRDAAVDAPATVGDGAHDASGDGGQDAVADIASDAAAADASDAAENDAGDDASTAIDAIDAIDAGDAGDDATLDCPPPPADLLEADLTGPGNPIIQTQLSGQVVAIPLPDVSPRASGEIEFGESPAASTPQPVTLEVSISRCRGVIDTDLSNYCNLRSTNGNFNVITYLLQPYMTIDSAAAANLRGYCWAPLAEGPWYVNARWTYDQCGFGSSTCGFAIQYNDGPY